MTGPFEELVQGVQAEHIIEWGMMFASAPPQYRCRCGFMGTAPKARAHENEYVVAEVLAAQLGDKPMKPEEG